MSENIQIKKISKKKNCSSKSPPPKKITPTKTAPPSFEEHRLKDFIWWR